jgi:hypothetical protein
MVTVKALSFLGALISLKECSRSPEGCSRSKSGLRPSKSGLRPSKSLRSLRFLKRSGWWHSACDNLRLLHLLGTNTQQKTHARTRRPDALPPRRQHPPPHPSARGNPAHPFGRNNVGLSLLGGDQGFPSGPAAWRPPRPNLRGGSPPSSRPSSCSLYALCYSARKIGGRKSSAYKHLSGMVSGRAASPLTASPHHPPQPSRKRPWRPLLRGLPRSRSAVSLPPPLRGSLGLSLSGFPSASPLSPSPTGA